MTESTERLWKNDRWWTSRYNFDTEVRKQHHFSPPIELHDVTLRDGEQTPGVVFTREEKVEIARGLDEARVHRIEAGMPLISDEDRLAIKDIARQSTFSKVFGFCRAKKEDIDACLGCDVFGVIVEIAALEQRLKVMGLTVAQATSSASDVIDYAKRHGLFVVFFPIDATRTEFETLSKFVKVSETAHADRLAVVDTAAAASPDGFGHLVRKAKGITKTPLEVHCHNSFGLGTANTIAGLAEGARAAHVSVNGIGEGAGNVALEEVVLSLRLLYGIDCGVDLQKLHEVSKTVEKHSRLPIPDNKPVFGRNIFRRESGIVIERYYKMPEVARELELFDPAWFAGETEVVLGKKSGKYSILYALKKRGLSADDAQVKQMLEAVKTKSVAKKGTVTDEEFDQIARTVLRG